MVFTPTIDPTETYSFHLFGHDITITPEILSNSIVATPQLTEQDKQIQELKEKNAALEKELDSLKALSDPDNILRLDANNDGIVDSNDASILLTIYAINSTGGHISKFSELPE